MSAKTNPNPKAPDSQPARGPAAVGKAPIAPGSSPSVDGKGLALPHERDEAPGATDPEPSPVMVQAKRDIDNGLVDTDMHASPGLDAARREQLVPGPGGKPPAVGDEGNHHSASKRVRR